MSVTQVSDIKVREETIQRGGRDREEGTDNKYEGKRMKERSDCYRMKKTETTNNIIRSPPCMLQVQAVFIVGVSSASVTELKWD